MDGFSARCCCCCPNNFIQFRGGGGGTNPLGGGGGGGKRGGEAELASDAARRLLKSWAALSRDARGGGKRANAVVWESLGDIAAEEAAEDVDEGESWPCLSGEDVC